MPYDFNADEMFNVAIRIEENGARFYRRAAELQEDPANREVLEKLAAMEDRHRHTFETMKQDVSKAEKKTTVFDPEGELEQYLAAMADTHGGEGSPAMADELTGDETIGEILDTALDLEKESILFYVGLKDLVPPDLGREKLDRIIAQERQHVIQLTALRKRMGKAP